MTARLPSVGGDDGNWGTVLNQYLSVQHNADGTHETTQTLTDQASITWDVSLGTIATVTLTDNRALANPTNLVNGASYILIVKQDSSGNHTLTYDSAYLFPGGLAPVLSTGINAVDLISFLSDGTNLYGAFLGNFG